MKTVLILSGGMDSAVLLAHLKKEGHEIKTVSFNYRQRHRIELESAKRLADFYQTLWTLVDLKDVAPLLGGSSQTDSRVQVPQGRYDDESMKKTVVPNRNMIMLSIAAAYAISLRYDTVSYGAHAGDHTIYPDCRPAFIDAMNHAFNLCDWHNVQIHAPFAKLSKTQICSIGHGEQVPFNLTYSCYEGMTLHCGKCGACTERKEAFEQACVVDPTRYFNG